MGFTCARETAGHCEIQAFLSVEGLALKSSLSMLLTPVQLCPCVRVCVCV